MRKFESLFSKIYTFLRKTNTCTGLQAETIFSWYIYIFSIVGVASAVIFLFFEKLQLLVIKCWNNFYCIVLLFIWAQKACLRSLNFHFKLDILIFLFFVVSFLVDIFKQKASFLMKKHQRWNLRHTLEKKVSKFNVAKY